MVTRISTTNRRFISAPNPYVLWTLERLVGSSLPAMQGVGSTNGCVEAFERTEGRALDRNVLDANIGRDKWLRPISKLKTSLRAKI